MRDESCDEKSQILNWIKNYSVEQHNNYNTHLYSEAKNNAKTIKEVKPIYDENSKLVDARVVLKNNFDIILSRYKEVLIFGEDAGKIGDVNQGLEGLQEKYGKLKIADTGIREATIMGQGIGLAMRGLRPIAEIQYLDYMLYGLQILSDDLATLRYRSLVNKRLL